jgi:hypothetical protein
MPYRLVKGKYSLFYRSQRNVGSRPSGDSIWFEPDNREQLSRLGGRQVRYSKGGYTMLRLEGIDALELGFQGLNHQKIPESLAARDRLLHLLGFEKVIYEPALSSDIDTVVLESNPREIGGYILARTVDPDRRPVAFAFVGNPPYSDGSDIGWLSLDLMVESLNAQLIAGGHVYPSYYTGLPTDLRNKLTDLVIGARNCVSGLWSVDVSSSGAQVKNAGDLEHYAMWPKLYRRLMAFFSEGHTDIGDFDSWIRQDPKRDDQLWIISHGELGNLHDICTLADKTIRLKVRPEDIVIVPR